MNRLFRIVLAVTLIIVMGVPSVVFAERASNYIISYMGAPASPGGKTVQVGFSITAKDYMDDIGATDIYLYEKLPSSSTWSQVKYYHYTQSGNSNMMSTNKSIYSSYVSYTGISGRQYYAKIYFWAGKNGGGDSREYITQIYTLP